MANSLGLSAPKYAAPADWQKAALDIGDLRISRTGAYFADQASLDTAVAAVVASGEAVVWLDIPPMGYTNDPRVLPNAYYPTPALLAEIVNNAHKAATSMNTRKVYQRDAVKLGPISTDFTSVTLNAPGNATYYTNQYLFAAGAANLAQFADLGPTGLVYNLSSFAFAVNSGTWMPQSYRFMCDDTKVALYVGNTKGPFMVYIDGRPTSLTPYLPTVGVANYVEIVFPSAATRLVEIRGYEVGLYGVYVSAPHRIWKPPPLQGPRMLVVGDSYAQGVGSTNLMNAMYYNIGPEIGIEDFLLDGIGGTGYGVTSAANGTDAPLNRYSDRLHTSTGGGTLTWDVGTLKPDVVLVHGGGANDLNKGRTVAQITADVIAYFQQLRALLPDARLIFLEGFAPPTFAFNTQYVAIRQAVQAALTATGVYYIDVATTSPWIDGTGRVGAVTGLGNSDLYIGGDSTHPVDAGYLYLRKRLAPKIRRILNDNGTLLNQLI